MIEILNYYSQNFAYVWMQCVRHFLIAFYGVLIAAAIAIPLGIYMARKVKLSAFVISLANIIQTIPSLALLSVIMVVLGLGPNTVIAVVCLYSLLPIFKNTVTAINGVDQHLLDVAKGMGMTKWQILTSVELPLSLSIIMAGLRNAIVVGIGVTTIGTFIGAGGLGDIISRGINVSNGAAIIWAGVIPVALMAILADFSLGLLETRLSKVKR